MVLGEVLKKTTVVISMRRRTQSRRILKPPRAYDGIRAALGDGPNASRAPGEAEPKARLSGTPEGRREPPAGSPAPRGLNEALAAKRSENQSRPTSSISTFAPRSSSAWVRPGGPEPDDVAGDQILTP